MEEINAKKSKLDKEWTTNEMDTSIHHYIMYEQYLWDITHSDYSKDVRQRHWLKSKKKPFAVDTH